VIILATVWTHITMRTLAESNICLSSLFGDTEQKTRRVRKHATR